MEAKPEHVNELGRIPGWILKAIARIRLPLDLPGVTDLPFDARVFLFSLSTCVLTTLLFGLAPSLHAARIDLLPALKNQVSERFRRVQLGPGDAFRDPAGGNRAGGPEPAARHHHRRWIQSPKRRRRDIRPQPGRL
ncbi:MAG TPA: hypothetical protein VEV17_12440 [Bryobacteraceae bacterium]|nr:hypothetical protein [Bryobacteraceae bacterium]